MEITVHYNFPKSFVFPPKCDFSHRGPCNECPFLIHDDYWSGCFLTNSSNGICPFYGGNTSYVLKTEE